ncbi:MAG: tRNA (adenosine(37)-N6)-threonylcarbamoyltransferase complex transferase subunit TsaD [Oscillospiraceae bacterium]|jgi:N6-L-threonylcarbamoyladenine synthase|nr:tRNA (adenosine(37)-N6)-threonylcarbamoyltransferase complex transferase subunit TsaD [Oscillospiraceae bacterium]
MLLLALETSCDETAAAVVADGRAVCSNVVASQIPAHRVFGGVVPEIASRMHLEAVSGVTDEALRLAGAPLSAVDAVAVTFAPGLVGALLVGVNFAKSLAYAADKPLVPVHHLRGHVAANYLTHPDLAPPFLCLVVSGGHTHLVDVAGYTSFRVLGQTHDDAAGEALDKTARALGLPYPGGVHLDRLGRGGNPHAFDFPRPRIAGHPLDFSFSGLKTAALNAMRAAGLSGSAPEPDAAGHPQPSALSDFAASFQFAVADYLCQTALRAAREAGRGTLVLAGGVCANTVLRREMAERCAAAGLDLRMPALCYCGDNAAMIAAQGYYEFQAGSRAALSLNAVPSLGIE